VRNPRELALLILRLGTVFVSLSRPVIIGPAPVALICLAGGDDRRWNGSKDPFAVV